MTTLTGPHCKTEIQLFTEQTESKNDSFILENSFTITVPKDYKHEGYLGRFTEKYKENFYYFNENITDNNFPSPTHQLIPGKKYKASLFKLTRDTSSWECLAFLKSNNSYLVGAQGAAMIFEQSKDEIELGMWVFSFDEKDVLWQNSDGYHGVPGVSRYWDGDYRFPLGAFERGWSADNYLIHFSDV